MPPKRITSGGSSKPSLERLSSPGDSTHAPPKVRRMTRRQQTAAAFGSGGARRRNTNTATIRQRSSRRRNAATTSSSDDEDDDTSSSDDYTDSSSMHSSSGDSSASGLGGDAHAASMPTTPTTPTGNAGGSSSRRRNDMPLSPQQHALNSPLRQMRLAGGTAGSMVVTPTTPTTPTGRYHHNGSDDGALDHLIHAAGLLQPAPLNSHSTSAPRNNNHSSLYDGLGPTSAIFAAYPDLTPLVDTRAHPTYTLNPDEWDDAEGGYDAYQQQHRGKRKSPQHTFFVIVLGWRPNYVDTWTPFAQKPLIDTNLATYQIVHHQANSAARDVLSQLFGNRLADPVTQQPILPNLIPDYWSKFVNRIVYVAVYDTAKRKVSVFTSTAEWVAPSERMPFERTRLAPFRELMTFNEIADAKEMRSVLYIRQILDVHKSMMAVQQQQSPSSQSAA